MDSNEALHLIRDGHIRKKLVSYNLFACWFQPGLFNQPTVFSSHNKPAPASPNQPRNQPANTPLVPNCVACASHLVVLLLLCILEVDVLFLEMGDGFPLVFEEKICIFYWHH